MTPITMIPKTSTVEIRRIDVRTAMMIGGVGYGAVALIGAVAMVILMLTTTMPDPTHLLELGFFNLLGGGFMILLTPFLYALLGAVAGGFVALVYNLFAYLVTGVVLEVAQPPPGGLLRRWLHLRAEGAKRGVGDAEQ